jgi:hypothetical protein
MKSADKMGDAKKLSKYVLDQIGDVKKLDETEDNSDKNGLDFLDGTNESLKKSSNIMQNATQIESIYLPLPNELTDSHSHDWGTEKNLVGTISEKLNSLSLGGINADKALGMIANSTGTRKPLLDPGYFQNYTGTQPREFNLTFDFIPNNQEEAQNMIKIMHLIRQYSLPSSVLNGVVLLAPHFFDIEVTNKYINGLLNIRGVVLTNMSVNYGADGQMQQTYDGIPKYMQMTLSFREKSMSLSEHFRQK